MIAVHHASAAYEREPLLTPFGFKGRAVTELWQSIVTLRDEHGRAGIGVGTQSPLWSDATAFAQQGEADSNRLMFEITVEAMERCRGRAFSTPGALLDEMLPRALAFGRSLGGAPQLRSTFALNALAPFDHAAWQLHAASHHTTSLDALLGDATAAFTHRHARIAAIPAIGYADTPESAADLVRAGSFILKIKIGGDPDGDGDRRKMLAWDCQRIAAIHAAVKDFHTPHTLTGHIAYYLDANGRYDHLTRVSRLLDHCDRIGALRHIVLLEEPFAETDPTDVRHLPVRVAADESAASVEDTLARIDAGYGAIALKPAAKTLTMSLRMAAAAQARGVPCFCADLTANPILLESAKNLAARLAPIPGLRTAAFETNGAQHYRDWDRLKSYHPHAGAPWSDPLDGVFHLDDTFYALSGGLFSPPGPHYAHTDLTARRGSS